MEILINNMVASRPTCWICGLPISEKYIQLHVEHPPEIEDRFFCAHYECASTLRGILNKTELTMADTMSGSGGREGEKK